MTLYKNESGKSSLFAQILCENNDMVTGNCLKNQMEFGQGRQDDRKAQPRNQQGEQSAADKVTQKMDSGKQAGQGSQAGKAEGQQDQENREGSHSRKVEQGAGNQKSAGGVSAGKGAAGFVFNQRGKAKPLKGAGRGNCLAKEGDRKKAHCRNQPEEQQRERGPTDHQAEEDAGRATGIEQKKAERKQTAERRNPLGTGRGAA